LGTGLKQSGKNTKKTLNKKKLSELRLYGRLSPQKRGNSKKGGGRCLGRQGPHKNMYNARPKNKKKTGGKGGGSRTKQAVNKTEKYTKEGGTWKEVPAAEGGSEKKKRQKRMKRRRIPLRDDAQDLKAGPEKRGRAKGTAPV